MPYQQLQHLHQLIHLSEQPALLVEIASEKIIASNSQLTNLLNLESKDISTDDLYLNLMDKAHTLIDKELLYFNYEIYSDDAVFLILAEVKQPYLVIYLQEKFNRNIPSSQMINILDNLGAYVYSKDLNFKYTYANKMVSELFGEDRNKLIGMSDADFFGLKHTQDSMDNLVISNKECIEKEETLFFNNSNETRTYLSVKKPLYDEHNKIVGLFGISTDITKNKETEKKLNIILDNVAAYIYILGTNHQFIYANKMTQTLLRLPMKEIKGKKLAELFGEENGMEFQRLDLELLKTKKTVEGVETFISGDITNYFWTVKAPLYDEDTNITSIIGMSTDITKQVELEKHLEQANENLKIKIKEITKLQDSLWEQATQDPLTKLFNRRYFNEHIEKEIQRNIRSKQPIALLLIDADYFKKINDNFGHDIGDTVLIKLSKIMIGECRRTDIICRFGGEEFIILMPNTNQKTAFERAEKIRLRYQTEISDLLNTSTTLSVGIAMWSLDYKNSEEFIKAADLAMYQAKENGRNQVVIYS